MQVEKTDKRQKPRSSKRWYKRWWAWCLWIFLTLCLAVMLFALWVWTQRYALIKNYVVEAIAEAGFDADLEIDSLSGNQAKISDIRINRAGEEILRIEDFRAEYVWSELRAPQLNRLDVKGLEGRLALGQDWRPSEAWLAELLAGGAGGGGASPDWFPEKGIGLTESRLTLLSPLGQQTFEILAEISTPKSFAAEVILPMSDLSYGDISAKGFGSVVIERLGGDEIITQGAAQTETLANSKHQIEDAILSWGGTVNLNSASYAGYVSVDGHNISGDLFSASSVRSKWEGDANLEQGSYDGTFSVESQMISNDVLTIEAARISGDGTVNLDIGSYDGKLSIESEAMSSALLMADAARVSWDGKASTADGVVAKGKWAVSAQHARASRRARAAELAETLSLFPALSVVPVTEHYAPDLKKTVETFFLGADVTGDGDIEYGPEGFKLTPNGAMQIQTEGNSLKLRPRAGEEFYRFDANQGSILAQMEAAFEIPIGLTLTDIELRAKSTNGVSLGGIDHFAANLETRQDWTALDEDNRPVRLGPLATSLRYNATANPRRLSVNTALDYDGALPGGRVEGLKLEGLLDVRLYEDRQVLDFTPLEGSQVTVKSMETPTDWFGEDMSFNIPHTPNLFTRTAEKSTLIAKLQRGDFTLTQPATASKPAQRLDVQSAGLDLNGTLFPDRTQDWVVDFQDVLYASETLPGPGTTASAKQASLTARLTPGQASQITVSSPSITAETPLARLSNFEVALTGTPEAYNIAHKGGSVDVIGSEFSEIAEMAGLASFPADGRVEFVDGKFIGQSNLVVAKANDAAVSVAYEFANGAGRADIEIPSILFAPQGLQPQTLVPAFSGKIARVEGEARAKINIAFADGALTDSSGTVQLVDMAVGTAPGPITGLNTNMSFSSLWPLKTEGQQKMTLRSFNPGMPLEDGVLTYSLVPDGVEVFSADWPIGKGWFSLDPFTWRYGAEENRVTMRVKDVALGDFLNDLGNQKIHATGNVVGEFPVVVRGIEVLIEGGIVSVPDGGVITYDPGPNVPTYNETEAIAVLSQRRASEYASLAQDALRKFRYQELSATINGPLEGDVEIGMVFDGSNDKLLNRQPFRFDISVIGELFNIARSFNSNGQLKSEVLRQNGRLPEGTIIAE